MGRRDGSGEAQCQEHLLAALAAIGQGCIGHVRSVELRASLAQSDLDPSSFYRQLLWLAYRLLFLLALAQKRACGKRTAWDEPNCFIALPIDRQGAWTWEELNEIFTALRSSCGSLALVAPLFAIQRCGDLENAHCDQQHLSRALCHLAAIVDRAAHQRRRLSFLTIASAYQGALAFAPSISVHPRPIFRVLAGSHRKQTGAYYTPEELVEQVLDSALEPVIQMRLKTTAEPRREQSILDLRICDPAAGPGTFLVPAAERLARRLADMRGIATLSSDERALYDVLQHCIYGVDQDLLSVILCRLSLVFNCTGDIPEALTDHICWGDSLVGAIDPTATGSSPSRTNCNQWGADLYGNHERQSEEAHPAGEVAAPPFHWPLEFPEVFSRGGADVVLANPPWERLQPEEVPFFRAHGRYDIAGMYGIARKRAITDLSRNDPSLLKRWRTHEAKIQAQVRFIRQSGRYSLAARGKINTYAAFTETVCRLLHPQGRAGCIVPSGLLTDCTSSDLFTGLIASHSLLSAYHFDNRAGLFPDVGSSVTFCLLTLQGNSGEMRSHTDFACFLHHVGDLDAPSRHFQLTEEDLSLLSPHTGTCPIFRTTEDAERVKSIYRRMPILGETVPPSTDTWDIQLRQGHFNMTNASPLFRTAAHLADAEYCAEDRTYLRFPDRYLPLYEAKMLHQFDHRWSDRPHSADSAHPSKVNVHLPRYWIEENEVKRKLGSREWILGCRLICRSTDERTVICTVLPRAAFGNSVVLLSMADTPAHRPAVLGACLNSFMLDYLARQRLGGVNLNFHVLEQLPVPPPSVFDEPAAWAPRKILSGWITERALELVYTTPALRPFARACGYDGPPFGRNHERRFTIRCELDAAFFHLYRVSEVDVRAIMDTFPVVKRRDEARFGTYRTMDQIVTQYRALQDSGA